MKNHLITLLLVSGILFCCKKDDPEKIGPCGVKDPVNELPWLKEKIELYSKPPDIGYAYFTTLYKGERVFWLYGGLINIRLEYRTCDGEVHSFPSPLPNDEETQRFKDLVLKPSQSCEFLIWSSPVFKQSNTCK